MKNNILVIGGTGKTGRKVVERLEKLNYSVRIGSRNASPAFDWNNADNWPAVLEGIDKMYVTYQPDLAVPGARDAITKITQLAKEKGVKKMVLLSGKGEREAELCEQVLIHSGLDFTIVRATWFNQNFSESFLLDPILAGHVALPLSEARVPYVDTNDIADVVVESLLNDEHNGKIYELTGPEALTFTEIVDQIAQSTGRTIKFTPVSLPEYVKMMEDFQVPADYIWLINYLFTEVFASAGNDKVTNDIEKVLGRPPIHFSDYVKETADKGIWQPQTAPVN